MFYSKAKNTNQKRGLKLVLILKDCGAILTLIKDGKILKSTIHKGEPLDMAITFNYELKRYKKAPLFLLLDIPEQEFKVMDIPRAGDILFKKIINNQILLGFDNLGLSSYNIISKSDKDVKISLVNIPITPYLKSCIEVLKQFSNPLEGIYSLPLETGGIESFISSNYLIEDWSIFVYESILGGIRITAMNNNKTIFSRIANISLEFKNGIDNLISEINATVSYIKRMGYNGKKIKIIMISPEDKTAKIEKAKFSFESEKQIINSDFLKKDLIPSNDALSALYFIIKQEERIKFSLLKK